MNEDTMRLGLPSNAADCENEGGVSDELDFITYTIDFWRRKSGVELTPERARAMISNVSEYFRLLDKLDRKSRL